MFSPPEDVVAERAELVPVQMCVAGTIRLTKTAYSSTASSLFHADVADELDVSPKGRIVPIFTGLDSIEIASRMCTFRLGVPFCGWHTLRLNSRVRRRIALAKKCSPPLKERQYADHFQNKSIHQSLVIAYAMLREGRRDPVCPLDCPAKDSEPRFVRTDVAGRFSSCIGTRKSALVGFNSV